MKIYIYLFIFLTVGFFGCSASLEGIIEANKEDSKKAVKQVLENTGMFYQEGPLDAELYIGEKNISEKNADFFVKKNSTNIFNNTSTMGVISLVPNTYNETYYKATFTTISGDPKANANLYLQMAQQQINLDKGIQVPIINPTKSGLNYTLLTIVSPILSVNYLIDDNPLISRSNHKWLYVQNGFGDFVMVALFVAGAFAKDSQSKYFTAGLSISLLWKVFSLFNLTDLSDYNDIAKTPYNLREIKTE